MADDEDWPVTECSECAPEYVSGLYFTDERDEEYRRGVQNAIDCALTSMALAVDYQTLTEQLVAAILFFLGTCNSVSYQIQVMPIGDNWVEIYIVRKGEGKDEPHEDAAEYIKKFSR
jgi:hypothetical protein